MSGSQASPSPRANPWVIAQPPRPGAAARLFCFPHAGGSAWAFREWSSWMPERIEVCAAQLPGHGNRIREPALDDFPLLLDRLARALEPELDRPFAMFGHSMGALLAFEVARTLRERTGAEPLHLFVSGHNGPRAAEESDDLDELEELDDATLTDKLRELNCTPRQVLENTELMGLMLPVIRADFAVCQTYAHRDGPRLACPMTVLGGLADPRTDREGLEAWRCETEGPVTVRHLPGDHFFIATQGPLIVQTIAREMAAAL